MRDFAAVLIHPRETMRRILDRTRETGRDRAVPMLVLGAILAGFAHDFDISGVAEVIEENAVSSGLFIAALLIAAALVFYLLFHAFAWIVMVIARLFEGKGEIAAVRSALAWGMAPLVWSLLYRVPVAISLAVSEAAGKLSHLRVADETFKIDPGVLAHGCGLALLIGFLDLVVTVWTLVVSSITLAEANGISAGHAFAVVLISVFAPVIVLLAAALAVVM
jgi:hypothetical protein